MTATPLGSRYLVRLREGEARSAGGIWLPDAWAENWTDGVIEAAGPGEIIGEGIRQRAPMWAEPGDVVAFQKHDWRAIGRESKIGMVDDRNLVGVMPAGFGHFEPLNDWVMVEQDPATEYDGAIALAPEYHPKPNSGRAVEWGPGQFRAWGAYYGTRRRVHEILNVDPEVLRGARVYWSKECEALACGRKALEFLLIKADDLWGMEVPGGGGA